jgi:hypothetical protein
VSENKSSVYVFEITEDSVFTEEEPPLSVEAAEETSSVDVVVSSSLRFGTHPDNSTANSNIITKK